MKKEEKLKIVYQIKDKYNSKLDLTLEKLLKKLGWKFEGSGFDFHTQERDLAFYKKLK